MNGRKIRVASVGCGQITDVHSQEIHKVCAQQNRLQAQPASGSAD